MLWTVAAPFMTAASTDLTWICDFAPPSSHRFRKVASAATQTDDWHVRAGRSTPLSRWAMTWRHASAALKGTDGLVTVFPPLALTGAIHRDLFHRDVPIVAWCFNVGSFPTGLKRKAARVALRRIDRIVVHSSAEVDLVREFLDLDEGVVQFVGREVSSTC